MLALILIIAGQLIVLSAFHEAHGEAWSETNAVITVAKLNYLDAKITLTVTPTPTSNINGTTNVKIIFPDGTTENITSANWEVAKPYTKTFSLPKTASNFGYSSGSYSAANKSIAVSQEEPLVVAVEYNVGDPQSYRISHNSQVMEVSTFIIYGSAMVSVRGYGVGL